MGGRCFASLCANAVPSLELAVANAFARVCILGAASWHETATTSSQMQFRSVPLFPPTTHNLPICLSVSLPTFRVATIINYTSSVVVAMIVVVIRCQERGHDGFVALSAAATATAATAVG